MRSTTDEEQKEEKLTENGMPLAVYTDMDDTDVTAGLRLLEDAGFEARILGSRDPDVIAAGAADAEALLIGYAEVDAALIARLPKLRIIALMSMGTNNVDLEAASARGIWVTNIPAVATEEVASHALTIALSVLRQVPHYSNAVQTGDWNGRSELQPPRLSQRTLGIVGLGRIGQKLAEFAQPLFAETVGYDPLLPDTPEIRAELERIGVRRTSLEEVQASADVLSLHVPLTPDTERMVNEAFISRMPEGAVLVNVSRGALIDGPALRSAVDSGRLGGAALDVLDEEPPQADHPLLGHPRIVITPHVAYFSDYTEAEYVRIQAQNAITRRETGTPDTPVNAPAGA